MVDVGAVILAHAVGDYVIQSDWMAREKVRHWWPAILHGVTYTLPFLFLTLDWRALAVISLTHIVIDRYRLARFVIWVRNWMSPVHFRRSKSTWFSYEAYNPPWHECRSTGFAPGRPAWLAFWLLIFADNTIHVLINVAAIAWFGTSAI